MDVLNDSRPDLTRSGAGERRAGARAERWGMGALLLLLLFTAASVAGYGIFALNPSLLPSEGFGLRLYAVSFVFFARAHIVLAAAVMAVLLIPRIGFRWVGAFAAVYGLSFLAEHVGTGYGFPFGGYEYTGLLGATLGGRVPFLIPVSWFLMALPSWVLGRVGAPGPSAVLPRVALGSLWLVAWDLALDPAMSWLTPYWVWAETGPYYGMPWINLLGWYATGLVLMGALELLASRSGWDRLEVRPMALYYAVMMALPVGMLAAAGAWGAVGVTAAGVGLCWAVTRSMPGWSEGRRQQGAPAADAPVEA